MSVERIKQALAEAQHSWCPDDCLPCRAADDLGRLASIVQAVADGGDIAANGDRLIRASLMHEAKAAL